MRHFASLPFLLSLAVSTQAAEETATSHIVGFNTATVCGTSGIVDRETTFLATPLVRREIWSGSFAELDGRRLRPAYPFAADEELQEGETYYLEVTSGPREGYEMSVEAWTGGTFLTYRDFSGVVEPGESFALRPYPTLQQVFGSGADCRLHAGPDREKADHVLIPDPESGRMETYFPRVLDSGKVVWCGSDGLLVETSPVLAPGSGVIVRRVAEDDVRIVVSGDVTPHVAIISVEPGMNLIASGFPVDATLDSMFGPDGGGLVAGSSPADADSVSVPRPYGGMRTFFRKIAAAGGPGRFSPDAPGEQGDTVIAEPGEVVLVHRTQGPAFNLKQVFDH